jgi:3-hydroxybutyryl-CoA dehydrogenase
MKLEVIGVVGAGQMGAGIAQVALMSGLDVIMQDLNPEGLIRGKTKVEQGFLKLVEKGKVSETDAVNARKRLHTTQHLEDF